MVMRRAFSHSWPIASIIPADPAPPGMPQTCTAAPAASPRASAASTRTLSDDSRARIRFGGGAGTGVWVMP